MKRVIIFATNDYHDTPYRNWFGTEEVSFLFLTTEDFCSTYQAFGETINIVQGSEDFPASLLQRLTTFGADVVFARNERDVLPAAKLRLLLNIPGQSIASAEAYRNKFIMKTYVAASSVALPKYTILTSVDDVRLITFPMPWAFKPLDDSGSGGVTIISNIQDLNQWKTSVPSLPFLAESYVDGQMYHVDGLAKDGKVLWSHVGAYMQGCLAFRDNSYAGSRTILSTSSLALTLQEKARVIVNSLPRGSIHPFHAEFFVTPQGEIVFCEIASRTPGGRIKQFVEVATGVDLDQACLRLLLDGKAIPSQTQGCRPTGWILIYPKQGTLEKVLPGSVHPAIYQEKLHGVIGASYNGGEKSGRGLWSCIYQAPHNEILEGMAHDIYENFTAKTIWQKSWLQGEKRMEAVW